MHSLLSKRVAITRLKKVAKAINVMDDVKKTTRYKSMGKVNGKRVLVQAKRSVANSIHWGGR